jgi:hypothetical protein
MADALSGYHIDRKNDPDCIDQARHDDNVFCAAA